MYPPAFFSTISSESLEALRVSKRRLCADFFVENEFACSYFWTKTWVQRRMRDKYVIYIYTLYIVSNHTHIYIYIYRLFTNIHLHHFDTYLDYMPISSRCYFLKDPLKANGLLYHGNVKAKNNKTLVTCDLKWAK